LRYKAGLQSAILQQSAAHLIQLSFQRGRPQESGFHRYCIETLLIDKKILYCPLPRSMRLTEVKDFRFYKYRVSYRLNNGFND